MVQELGHAGHIAPFAHAGLGQMPASAPVIMLSFAIASR